MQKIKILIIKLGYSETLDHEIGKVPSLGDVLRTTPILHALKEKYVNSEITWVVSEAAAPLLNNNKFIDKIYVWDEFLGFQLMREKFDVLVNLEKIAGICALSDMIDAWTKYGFRFDSNAGSFLEYEQGASYIAYMNAKKSNEHYKDFWQKVLIEAFNVEWKEQECILGYKPKTTTTYDIGLNYLVGSKWPTKAFDKSKWEEIYDILTAQGYKVSWQEGLKNLYEYMDWINSCNMLISHDSLGLHIALALNKKVLGLFGPTDAKEVYLYNRGKIIESGKVCTHMPCYSPECFEEEDCMSVFKTDDIIKNVQEIIKG